MGNPLLAQIPLVVRPGELRKPDPVNFELTRLPTELSTGQLEESIRDLEDVILSGKQILSSLATIRDKQALYANWKKETINRVAPGYLDGKLHMMAPTKRLGQPKEQAEEQGAKQETKPGEEAKVTDPNDLEVLLARAKLQ